MFLSRFFRSPQIFLKKCYALTTEKNMVNSDQVMLKKYQQALKLIHSRFYKEALSNLSEIIEANQNLKGSSTFNNLLESQVNCFYFLREYGEAENNCMNMVEFTKYNIKRKNIEFSKSTLFQDYLKMLEVFIYSGNERVYRFSLI